MLEYPYFLLPLVLSKIPGTIPPTSLPTMNDSTHRPKAKKGRVVVVVESIDLIDMGDGRRKDNMQSAARVHNFRRLTQTQKAGD